MDREDNLRFDLDPVVRLRVFLLRGEVLLKNLAPPVQAPSALPHPLIHSLRAWISAWNCLVASQDWKGRLPAQPKRLVSVSLGIGQ